jgi:hypothetical protein
MLFFRGNEMTHMDPHLIKAGKTIQISLGPKAITKEAQSKPKPVVHNSQGPTLDLTQTKIPL